MRPYQDIVRAWAAEQPLDDITPEQRRAIALIAAGAASEEQLARAGAGFVRGIKASLPHQMRGVVADVEKVAEKANTLRFKFSDETPDRMGDIIRQAGWNLDNYRKNAVILWGHARSDDADADEPIGRATRLWVEDKALWGEIEFAVEQSERAARKYRLAAAGYVKANSVGFRGGKTISPDSDEDRQALGLGRYGVVFESGHELLEDSLCAIPANPNALQASVKSGAITEADADELRAQRTERDWERYLKRRARSSVAVPPLTYTITTETTSGLPSGSYPWAISIRDAVQAARDDRLERALEALAPLVNLAPALTELAHAVKAHAHATTDLGGCITAPRQVAQASAPATNAPALLTTETIKSIVKDALAAR